MYDNITCWGRFIQRNQPSLAPNYDQHEAHIVTLSVADYALPARSTFLPQSQAYAA